MLSRWREGATSTSADWVNDLGEEVDQSNLDRPPAAVCLQMDDVKVQVRQILADALLWEQAVAWLPGLSSGRKLGGHRKRCRGLPRLPWRL